MLNLLFFVLGYFCFAVAFFQIVQRPLFMAYNRRGPVPASDVWSITRLGLKTDRIVCSYLTAVPLLAAVVQNYVGADFLPVFMTVYNAALALVVSLLVVADTALYKFWEYKIDASVLPYLRSLKGATASVSTGYLAAGAAAVVAVGVVFFLWMQLIGSLTLSGGLEPARGLWPCLGSALVALALMACCFVFIRGLGRRPNNPSISFYSKVLFFNHSALNPIYSFIYSLSVNDKIEGAFREFPDEECEREFRRLFPTGGATERRLLNTNRPNVLLVVWESFGARYVESLGGEPDVAPNVCRLMKEGVSFTHVDCGSFRTDRGLVCILSGYLAQPTTSVIRMTKKLPHLPALPRMFKDAGYDTTVVHGGDLTIFHKLDYYLTIGHDRVVEQSSFPSSAPTGKWGVHDGVVFDWLYDDIMEKTGQGRRWYTTFQTLSSHETWDVPYQRLDNKIHNSFAYVDDAFGRFVDRLKQTPAWKDLLIVVVADHGCNDAGGVQLPREKYAHIPLFMIGGAVKEPVEIDTLMSQTDLASTLLAQLDMPYDRFIFSRNVLSDAYTEPFGFHDYNNGFLLRDSRGFTDYDNTAGCAVTGADAARERAGKIILQKLYADLASR